MTNSKIVVSWSRPTKRSRHPIVMSTTPNPIARLMIRATNTRQPRRRTWLSFSSMRMRKVVKLTMSRKTGISCHTDRSSTVSSTMKGRSKRKIKISIRSSHISWKQRWRKSPAPRNSSAPSTPLHPPNPITWTDSRSTSEKRKKIYKPSANKKKRKSTYKLI